MPDSTPASVDVPRVAQRQVLQPFRQRLRPHLQSQVHMIGHQAESMHTVCEAASTFLDQTIKHHPVLVFEEDILAVVAAQDDMIEPTGQVQAWFARHPQRLRQGCPNRQIANLIANLTRLTFPNPVDAVIPSCGALSGTDAFSGAGDSARGTVCHADQTP